MIGLGNESYNPVKKPKTLICYICGREYGTLSLPIHLKTCEQKFITEEEKKPKHLRRPLPQPPKAFGSSMNYDQIDQYNQGAFQTYNNDALETCQNCGRTFKPESLIVHQRMCKPDRPFKQLPGFIQDQNKIAQQQSKSAIVSKKGGDGNQFSSPQISRPKTLMCYVCGREYGTKSLPIHIKQCKEMFLIQEQKKPLNQRRKLPTTPKGLSGLLEKGEFAFEDMEGYNNGAFDKYNKEALVPCNFCGRTFKPESLVHHAKACFADKPFKPLSQQDTTQTQNTDSEYIPKSQGQKLDPSKTTNVPNSKWVENKKETSNTKSNAPQDSTYSQVIPQSQGSQVKKIFCYICKKSYTSVLLKVHIQDCQRKSKYDGQVPGLFNDLIKITDPSEYLIDLYHQSIGINSNNEAMVTQSLQPEITKSEVQTKRQDSVQQQDPPSNYRKQFNPNQNNQEQQYQYEVPQIIEKLSESQRVETDMENQEQHLAQCSKCDRNFAVDRLSKHMKVCKGMKVNEVKVEKPQVVVSKPAKGKETEVPKWKQQHEDFVKIMQYNKQLKEIEDQGGDIRKLGPPPKQNNDNLEECRYCNRKFDPSRIEKHLSICQNVINKPKPVPSQPKNPYEPNSLPQPKNFKINTPQKTTRMEPQTEIKQPRPDFSKSPARSFVSTHKPVAQVMQSSKTATKTQTQQPDNIFRQTSTNSQFLKPPQFDQQMNKSTNVWKKQNNNKSQDFSYGAPQTTNKVVPGQKQVMTGKKY